jgi:chromosome segregation ATPase
LAANVALGYFVWDTRSTIRRADEVVDQELADAQSRLDAMTEEALGQLSRLVAVERSVDSLRADLSSDLQALEGDLTDIERAVFGAFGPRPGSLDAVGSLEREIETLKFCVNRAISSLQDYSERLVAWVGIVISGGVSVRPSAFIPRCY